MDSPVRSPAPAPGRWTSLWVVAALSLLAQLALCQFFSFGKSVPITIDINPSNLWKFTYHFPPTGTFQVLNWLGIANPPIPLNPLSLASRWEPWLFFTGYAPVVATLALLAMAAFLRELELPRPAALFGGVIFAWQGDLLSFIFPAHFGYITTWPFYAIAAWGALRAHRTGYWAYAVISGASCGLMVQLEQDRGGIAALYLAPVASRIFKGQNLQGSLADLRQLALCVTVALLVTFASFLALFQTNIIGVKLGGEGKRSLVYNMATQFCLGPEETLTYLVPGLFGWHSHHETGPYWGDIGERPDWSDKHQGPRNFNLAISTCGTVATVLALIGIVTLLPGSLLGASTLSDRQRFYGRWLLVLGAITLVLAWGWHTSFYRSLYLLPLMDKWRDPLKWLEVTNFALITFSAFGMQHLLASLKAGEPGTAPLRQRLNGFCLILLVILGLALVASFPYGSFSLPAKFQSDIYNSDPNVNAAIIAAMTASAASTLHVALGVAVALIAAFYLILLGLWSPDRLRGFSMENPLLQRGWQAMLRPDWLPQTLAISLALLGAVQLGWVAKQFIEPIELSQITASNPLLDALRAESDSSGNSVRSSATPEDPLLNELLLNQFNLFHIACLDISAASRIPDDLNAFLGALDNNRERLWFLAGVKNVAVPEQYIADLRKDPLVAANVDHAYGYTLVPTGTPNTPSHALIGLRDYLAKATFVPHTEVLSNEAMLARLNDPTWNPRDSILVSNPPPEPPASDSALGPIGAGQVTLKTYTPTEIQVEVKGMPSGYVLINDQFDPDWETEVNGQPAPLLRADWIMRAVAVPAGDSTITMRYRPRYHVGDIVRQMTGHNVGNVTISAESASLFSDGVMLAAWLIAGLAIWRRRNDGIALPQSAI